MNMTLRNGTQLFAVASELVQYGDALNPPTQRISDLRKMGFTIRSPRKGDAGVYTMSKTARAKLARVVKNAA